MTELLTQRAYNALRLTEFNVSLAAAVTMHAKTSFVNVRRGLTPLAASTMQPIPAVCERCDLVTRCDVSTSFWAFRLPQALGYRRELPCEPSETSLLGRDDVWLPVTHVGGPRRGPTDSGGLWFYYTPGCSDLLWHMGRTMLTRNRAHAAVVTEQRLAQLEGRELLSDRDAVGRLARYIETRHPRWPPLGRARSLLGKNASVEAVLAEAARGLYGVCSGTAFDAAGSLRPCSCAGNVTRHMVRSRRALALTPLAGDKVLSLHSEPLLRRLPLDTVAFYQQPQGGGSPLWTTEIWDVRGSPELSRRLENASAHPEVVARARLGWSNARGRLRAAACVPAPSWHTCMSCAGSLLEPHCNATVRWYAAKEHPGRG